MNAVEIPIVTTADTSGAKEQAEALKALTDESKRYEATLRKMAISEKAAAQEARNAAKETEAATAAAKKKAEADYNAQAQLKDGLSPALAHYGDQAQQAAAKTEKLTDRKGQLKAMAKGLAVQFPVLGHAAALALNPIALAVAAIIGTFVTLKKWIGEVTRSMAGMEFPEISDSQIGRIQKVIDIYGEFNKALAASVENYRSANQESERFAKNIDQQAKNSKALLDAQKQLDLAKLEADKDKLPAGEYERRKAGIEDAYAARGLTLDENTRRAQLAEKARRGGNLLIEAARKTSEADAIRVGSEERESAAEEKAKKLATAAAEDQVIRKTRLGEIADYRGGGMNWLQRKAFEARFTWNYGYGVSLDEAEAMERGHVASNEGLIAGYNNFAGRRPQWAELRRRRGELTSGAGGAAGQAFGIMTDLPSDQAAMERDFSVGRQVGAMGSLSRAYGAAGAVEKGAADVAARVAAAVEKGSQVDAHTVRALESFVRSKQEILQKIAQLESQMVNMRAR